MPHIYNVIAPSGIKTDKKYPLIYCQGQCLVHWRWIRQDSHYCLRGHGGFLRLSSLSKCMVLTGKRGRTRNYVFAFFSSSFPTTSLWKDTNLLFGFSQLQIPLFFLSPLNILMDKKLQRKSVYHCQAAFCTISPWHVSVWKNLPHWWEKIYIYIVEVHIVLSGALSAGGSHGRRPPWRRLNTVRRLCCFSVFLATSALTWKGNFALSLSQLSFWSCSSQLWQSPNTVWYCTWGHMCHWHTDLA